MIEDRTFLYNDDCYTRIKKIPDKSIDLIITDPPYDYTEGGWGFSHSQQIKDIARSGLQGGGAFRNKNKQHFNEITNNVYENKKITTQHKSYGSDFGADTRDFYKEINKGIYKIDESLENVGGIEHNNIKYGFDYNLLNELDRVMKRTNIYIWCSKKQLIPLVYHYVVQKKCNWNIINWCKTNSIPTCNNKYLTDVEYCLFFRDKGVRVYGSYDTKHTYYVTPINQKDKKIWKHPTIKPEFIVDNFIINSSNENDTILDPFMGSGTTGACCKRLNRKFIGIEINTEYFDIAEKRINSEQINEQVSEQAKNEIEELEGQIKLTD